ncbi:MAG: hypothetical protein Q8Q07_06655 [Dehalococcoidales bacterium]|nr:hypothetical protein [Dehalococcoidales bacterium]
MGKNGLASILAFIPRPPLLVRSIYAETLLEDFFVSAVASVLAIRFYLHITGFPQLGFGPLHIAHMLWGGLLLLIALVILLAFLNHKAKVTAAVVGGIGFGAFIDELGKFITRDNDYFFQPAVALIYVIFVLIFFIIRAVGKRRPLSSQECLANIFDIARHGSLVGLDEEERADALNLLESCEASPVRDNLRAILQNTQVALSRSPRPLARLHAVLDRFYGWAASRWWFGGIIITFFAFTAVTSVSAVVAVVEWSLGLMLWLVAAVIILAALVWSRRIKVRYLNIGIAVSIVIVSILISWAIVGNLKGMPLSIIDWAQLVFPGISGTLIAMGILTLPRSRLEAYLLFRWAILVSIFFTQVLSFYEQQILALLGLALNILILIALRYMVTHEHLKVKSQLTE